MPPIAPIAFIFAALLAGAAPGNAATGAAIWRAAPRQAWVRPPPLPYGDSAAPPAGAGLLLHDRQIRLTDEGDDRYEHVILRLTPAQAAAQGRPVTILVDPRFQGLVIHCLRLTHGASAARDFSVAQIREQLHIQAAEAEPRQRELAPQLLLALEVPGAQPGDLLEYEYTLLSRSSQYAGLVAGHYAAQWPRDADQAVHWERLHVSWPPGRALKFRVSPGAAEIAPQVRTQPGELDVQWRDLGPIAAESDTPPWFDRQGRVQLSDFRDWSEVAALLAPLYSGVEPHELPTHPPLEAVPGLVLNALRLLQSKVQPVNGAGEGPYLPADPALLLQRGFGDSHDLARELASLLRRLGIDAQVVLADSHRGAVLADTLPSPFILDSALVLVRAGSAQYWLNPAASGPFVALTDAAPGDWRHALTLGSGGRLVDLPLPAPDSQRRSVSEQFDLHAAATLPAVLTVITQYQGDWARAVRADLYAQSPAQLQLMQIQQVAQHYPDAEPEGAVQLQDLPDGRTVQLTAQFRLPHALGEARHPQIRFFADALAAAVQPRDEATRRLPLSLPWPLMLEEHIDARLPPDFIVPAGSMQIVTAAFRYQREVRMAQHTLHVTHRYVALADHLEPVDYPRFEQANAQVYEALELRLAPRGTPWQRLLEWLTERALLILVALVVAATLAIGASRRLRRQ